MRPSATAIKCAKWYARVARMQACVAVGGRWGKSGQTRPYLEYRISRHSMSSMSDRSGSKAARPIPVARPWACPVGNSADNPTKVGVDGAISIEAGTSTASTRRHCRHRRMGCTGIGFPALPSPRTPRSTRSRPHREALRMPATWAASIPACATRYPCTSNGCWPFVGITRM